MNEMTMTIRIEAPGLTAAIDRLAGTMLDSGALVRAGMAHGMKNAPAPVSAAPMANPAPAAAPVTSAAVPVSAPAVPIPAPATTAAPDVPVAPVAPTAPAPGYTVEQLSRVGADLLATDPAKLTELQALLQQFGVQAITMLPPEQYGAFATALRGLGAKI